MRETPNSDTELAKTEYAQPFEDTICGGARAELPLGTLISEKTHGMATRVDGYANARATHMHSFGPSVANPHPHCVGSRMVAA